MWLILIQRNIIYIGFKRCKEYDEFNVNRCYTCNKYGYNSKKCTSKQTCANCAEEHNTNDCPNPDKQIYVNCISIKTKDKFKVSTLHKAFDSINCEYYKWIVTRKIENTKYPFDPEWKTKT